jgi:carbonic anhydrase/acetyltransferase-like protein (isoleucine patch superfamily)
MLRRLLEQRDVHLIEVAGVRPSVAATVWIARDVILSGEVVVHDEATLLFGVIVRGDLARVEIGYGANVQDRVVIHADPGLPVVIGSESAIGHGAIVHGCRVGEGALVGMGATVLNGAVIGDGAVIGAGSLVLEHVEIPPRSLAVGSPAQVVRAVSGDAGRETARRYRELVAGYPDAARG